MVQFGPKERPDYLNSLTEKPALIFNEIPEPVFVQHLLPLIQQYRKSTLTPRNSPDFKAVDLSPWLAVSGGPYNEVAVYDKNPRERLFVVPPPIVRLPTAIPKIDRRDGGFGALYMRFDELLKHGNQREAYALIQKGVREQLVDAAHNTQIEYMLRWVQIYRRYQIPLAEMMGENGERLDSYLNEKTGTASQAPAKTTLQDSYDGYDDF